MDTDKLTQLRAYRAAVYERGHVVNESGASFPIAPDGLTERDADLLRDVVAETGARATMETGMAVGLSSLAMVEGLLMAGHENCRHIAVDPYQQQNYDNAGLLAVRDAGVADKVELRAEDSQLALPKMVESGMRFDAIFIDGDHRFHSVICDLYYADRLLRPGGTLIVDDVNAPSVMAAVNYFALHWPYVPQAHTYGKRRTYEEALSVPRAPVNPSQLTMWARWRLPRQVEYYHKRFPMRLAVLRKPDPCPEQSLHEFHGFW